MLVLVEGPAAGGKSQYVAEMLAAGEVDIQADVTALWVALSGAVRDATGRYPVRRDNDPALLLARYLQSVAVRQGLQEGFDVAVTTSQPHQGERWRILAAAAGATFSVTTLDPGVQVVTARLADADGNLSAECQRALSRWYDGI